MRLIDADALWMVTDGNHDYYERFEIENAPTVDAVPLEDYKSMERTVNKLTKAIVDAESVKHGHWTIEDMVTYERSYGGTLYEPVYKCSCCGRTTESYVRGDEPIMPEDADFPDFCGHCGAKMDEVTDGEIQK